MRGVKTELGPIGQNQKWWEQQVEMVEGMNTQHQKNLKVGPEELQGCVHQSKTRLGSYPRWALYIDGDLGHPGKSNSDWEALESHRMYCMEQPVLPLSIHERWQLVMLILPWLPEEQVLFFFFSAACTVLVCKMKVLNQMPIMVLLNSTFLWVTFWLCVSSSGIIWGLPLTIFRG